MKGFRIRKVMFLNPVTINLHGTSRGERFVTHKNTDSLEFINATWLRIELRGNVVMVPLHNIMAVEQLEEQDD